MEVPLHPEIERVLRQKVESGEYPSIAGLVEEALFLLVERDWSRAQAELLQKVPTAFDPNPEPPTEGERP